MKQFLKIQTQFGELIVHENENGLDIHLPKCILTEESKLMTISIPQCDVPGIQSNYQLSVYHFSEHEKQEAIALANFPEGKPSSKSTP